MTFLPYKWRQHYRRLQHISVGTCSVFRINKDRLWIIIIASLLPSVRFQSVKYAPSHFLFSPSLSLLSLLFCIAYCPKVPSENPFLSPSSPANTTLHLPPAAPCIFLTKQNHPSYLVVLCICISNYIVNHKCRRPTLPTIKIVQIIYCLMK